MLGYDPLKERCPLNFYEANIHATDKEKLMKLIKESYKYL